MYVFGKGKRATTVTAIPKTITLGEKVVVEGTVMDLSPAQLNTPCVSVGSMKLQMDYLQRSLRLCGYSIGHPMPEAKLQFILAVYQRFLLLSLRASIF
jgi:hypothetical protein